MMTDEVGLNNNFRRGITANLMKLIFLGKGRGEVWEWYRLLCITV